MSILTCTIPGKPEQQGSKRNVGKVSIEANKNLAPWRADAIANLQKAMTEQGLEKFVGPVGVEVTFVYQRPKGHYGSGSHAETIKATAPLYKTSAPDLDKLQRAVGDALTQAGVLRDDSLIVEWSAVKIWGELPGVDLIVMDTP